MLSRAALEGSQVVLVTFTHPVDTPDSVSVAGEFDHWSLDANPMAVDGGQAQCEIALLPGRTYRFRYVLDGERWENDWQADGYATSEFGGEDSVVDVTQVPPTVTTPIDAPAAPERRTKKSETTVKADA